MDDSASFGADFPDDIVEEDDQIVMPGGANVMQHLRSALAARGFAPSAVEQHSHYGWAFEVPIGSVPVWCMIQGGPDTWLLITEVPMRFFHRLLGRRPDAKHEAVLTALREILAAAPFRACTWTTRDAL